MLAGSRSTPYSLVSMTSRGGTAHQTVIDSLPQLFWFKPGVIGESALGSRSMSSTLCPTSARATPRLYVEVVFPLPLLVGKGNDSGHPYSSLNLEVSSTTCGETLPAVLNSL